MPVFDQETAKQPRRRTSVTGCITAGGAVVLLLFLIFFALPYLNLNGPLLTRHLTAARSADYQIPPGLSTIPGSDRGQDGTFYTLRIGNNLWGFHIPDRQ